MAYWFENGCLLGGLRALDAVLGSGTTPFFHAGGIECAANDVITNAGQILHTTATHEHNRVLLQVVTLVRDIGNNFVAVGETNLCDLADGRVRLFRGTGHHLHADATTESIAVQSWRLG